MNSISQAYETPEDTVIFEIIDDNGEMTEFEMTKEQVRETIEVIENLDDDKPTKIETFIIFDVDFSEYEVTLSQDELDNFYEILDEFGD